MAEISISNILSGVFDIEQKYDQIAQATGEKFNIFQILKIQSNEVLTHTPFIAELLNPKGSHGRGPTFLEIFIAMQKQALEQLNTKGEPVNTHSVIRTLSNLNAATTQVSIEKHIGFKNEEETEGGRIDILVRDHSGNAIVIENKVYAGDQNNQLVRYQSSYPNAPIFYLTLDGSKPSLASAGKLVEWENYICISYKHDVTHWLELCLKEACTFPLLRETINQYLYLIKTLTGQTMNNLISNEVVKKIISTTENISAAFTIAASQGDVRIELIRDLKRQLKALAESNNIKTSDDNFGEQKEGYFHFDIPNAKAKISICLGFDNYFQWFCIGVYIHDFNQVFNYSILKPEISSRVLKLGIGKDENYDNWAYLHYFTDDLKDWTFNKEIWIAIHDGTMLNRLFEMVSQIYDSIKDLDV